MTYYENVYCNPDVNGPWEEAKRELRKSASELEANLRAVRLHRFFCLLRHIPTKKAAKRIITLLRGLSNVHNLEDLRAASELLCPGVLEEATDLPSAQPVQSVELPPKRGSTDSAQIRSADGAEAGVVERHACCGRLGGSVRGAGQFPGRASVFGLRTRRGVVAGTSHFARHD